MTAIRVRKWNYFRTKRKFQRMHCVCSILKLENQTVEICLGYRPSPSIVLVTKVTSGPPPWSPASPSSPPPHPAAGSWSPWPPPCGTSAPTSPPQSLPQFANLRATWMVGLGSLAQEAKLLLKGSDQILAIVNVLLVAEKPITNDHLDWYAILQVDCTCQDLDLIKKQYRRLGLLLHPYKNPFSLADKHLGKTCDWIVALKALMLVNEGPSLFQEEILFAASVPGILGSWDQRLDLMLFDRKNIAASYGGGAGSVGL